MARRQRVGRGTRLDMVVHAVVASMFLVTVIVLSAFNHLTAPIVSAVGMGSFSLLTGSDVFTGWRKRQ